MDKQRCSTAPPESSSQLVRLFVLLFVFVFSPVYHGVSAHHHRPFCLTHLHPRISMPQRTGETKDAAANLASLHRKLQRWRDSSRLTIAAWAQLEAAVLTRDAELVLELPKQNANAHECTDQYRQAVSILSSALSVCLNARSLSLSTLPFHRRRAPSVGTRHICKSPSLPPDHLPLTNRRTVE